MTKYKICKWVIAISILVILVLSFLNYWHINSIMSAIMESAKDELDFSLNLPIGQYDAMHNSRVNYYTEVFHDLEKITKGVFDSNVLTFLVCFTLSLLFTILLSLQNRLFKQNIIVEKAVQQIENTKLSQQYYSRLQGLHCACMLFNEIINRNNYVVSESALNIVYIIDREVIRLLKELPENKSIFSKDVEFESKDIDSFSNIISNTIHLLSIERIRKSNMDNEVPIKSICNLYDHLNTLNKRLEQWKK